MLSVGAATVPTQSIGTRSIDTKITFCRSLRIINDGGSKANLYEVDTNAQERAVLVGVVSQNQNRWDTQEHIEELALLTDTAGAIVVDKVVQERGKIDAAYFVGRGKAEKLNGLADDYDANLLIFDDDLSPAQARNLEKLTNKKILDRSGLILDIFARRAKTHEARTQVELAQLNYLLPRLTRQWTHLSRQVGGIGARGPGETQLEVDRRLIRKRIATLKRDLEKIKGRREIRRRGRDTVYKIALVGYTNAGKSTLMNSLTDSDVFVEDRLFATLDPTVRRVEFSSDFKALLIDTVGFIRKLPHHLVASFKSTLEEVKHADVLLHVVDISHPHLFEHTAVVKEVLNDLNASGKPVIYVFNKIDCLEQKTFITQLKNDFQPSVFISAKRGLFLEDLKDEIRSMYNRSVLELNLHVDMRYAGIISKLRTVAEVVKITYHENLVEAKVKTTHANAQIIEYWLNVKTKSELNSIEFCKNGQS